MPIYTINILNFINELLSEQSTLTSLVQESDDKAKTLTQIANLNQIVKLLYKLKENYE